MLRMGCILFADVAIDRAVARGIRARMYVDLCIPIGSNGLNGGFDSTGCNTDCRYNHQYVNGTCEITTPVATYTGEVLDSNNQTVVCGCYYDNNGALFPPTTTTLAP
jgi:hypothetical protein